MTPDLARDVLAHHLRLFGLSPEHPRLVLSVRPIEATALRAAAVNGAVVVTLQPSAEFAATFGVVIEAPVRAGPNALVFAAKSRVPWAQLTTLHPLFAYRGGKDTVPMVTCSGAAVWLWKPLGKGGVLFIGTDLPSDLVRFRQGDPAQAKNRPTETLWGIAGERPIYLFEAQLAGLAHGARPADNWCMALRECLAPRLKVRAADLLPNGAPGALVITGDDDQAYLEKYEEQLALLDGLPITYFLHPLTRHTPETLAGMLGRPGIEVELHPDALEKPEAYGALLDEQVAWFRALTGRAPSLVRNHGFLNDGYWGHLPHWRRNRIVGTSNLPGVDGNVLSGSLLPARMAFDGDLTEHWSLLCAIGDGIRFSGGLSGEEAGRKVLDIAQTVRASGIPGVLALNLHPQNVSETREMHLAVKRLVDEGFQPWNLGQCLAWFEQSPSSAAAPSFLKRVLVGMRGKP